MLKKYFTAIILSLLLFAAISAQEVPQLPPVGIIDFYGLRTISEKQASSVLKIKPGDDAIETLKAVEENRRLLTSLPGVEDAAIHLVCCDDIYQKSIIFVGIREKGTPVLSFRLAPTGKIHLTEPILQAGKDMEAAFLKAIAAKDFTEDDSQGHTLFGNADVRRVQERFIPLASQNLKLLRQVLGGSSDPVERALAAQIIAYYPDKKKVVGDLILAVTDADDKVRNNATRALVIIANYALNHPALKIKIPAKEFIPMLNSFDWTDRNKSLGVMDALTKTRDAEILTELKNKALVSLTEMARWKSPGHAKYAFFILGRIAGFNEAEIDAMWKQTNRSEQIQKLLAGIK